MNIFTIFGMVQYYLENINFTQVLTIYSIVSRNRQFEIECEETTHLIQSLFGIFNNIEFYVVFNLR